MISVVIPVYNTGKSAAKLVERLLGDKHRDFEIILVDDGSTDDSLTILKKAARQDKRVKVVAQKNAGASSARNAGVDISQGEYLCFIDSDDMVAKNYLYQMVSAIEKKPDAAMVVCGRCYHRVLEGTDRYMNIKPCRQRRNREKLADYVVYILLTGERLYSSIDKVYRAEIVRKNKLRFEVGRNFAEDTKFVIDYLKYASGDIICVNKPLYIYYYGTETSTVRGSAVVWENWERQYQDMVEFAKETSGIHLKTFVLLKLLKLRWRVSHYRAVKRLKKAEKMRDEDGSNSKEGGKTAAKFVLVGVAVTGFDFLVCTVLTRWVFKTNDLQWVAAAVATFLATFVAYFAHSRITWKTRQPSKGGLAKFFAWNMAAAFVLKPITTWFFGLFTGLYQFATMICQFLHLPFEYDTIEYLGVYALATIVMMTLNFFFYDKLVFGKK